MLQKNSEDFSEFLKLLTENNVEYMIVGGYAVSFYSRPRYTDDLDVWINPTPENLKNILKVLNEFGFSEPFIKEDEFLNKPKIYRIGNPPVRIEILNSIDGVSFDDAMKNKELGSYAGLKKVFYISLNDLITNKAASNRPKDLLDLEYLKTFRKKN
ncbi:MAG: nucleotidyltransferase [Ignavibacteria bacterium]|nr:nucleotidyltransferase [Ignavibacteria bacterium]